MPSLPRNLLAQFTKQPGFALVVLLVLGLGIGSSTAVFSALYQMVVKPLPYPHADRIVFLHNSFPKNQVPTAGVSGFDYAEIKRHNNVFAEAGAFFWNDLTLTGAGSARHTNVVNASASLFRVLETKPELGRTFTEAEDQRGAPATAILSDALWHSLYGADANIIGRIIHLNGHPYTVIGVMPREFQFPSRETELWIPTSLRPGEFTLEGGRMEKWLHMAARLAPNVSLAGADSALQVISDQLGHKLPSFYPENEGWHFSARQIQEELTGNIRRWLYLAFAAVLSVLLIACINVSGLLLIRANARQGEIAVRMALGATRYQIVRLVLAETGFLVFCGCASGLLIALWAIHLLNLYGPLSQPIGFPIWSLLFSLVIAVISTVCIGLLPALLSAQVPLEQALRGASTRTSTAGSGWRNLIVAAQIAVAVTLIFTATQLGRSFIKLTQVPGGFATQHVWTAALDVPSGHANFFEPLLAQLKSLPGVQLASATGAIPFSPSGIWTEKLNLPEHATATPPPEAQINLAFPGYLETIGIPLLNGRTFTVHDRVGTPPVALIDRELARRYFGNEDPIGKQISSGGGTPARIIGVVGSVHNDDLGASFEPEVYYPALQEPSGSLYLVLRMNGNSDPTSAVRRAIATFDSGVSLYDVEFMDNRIAASLKLRRFVAFLLNGMAALGIALAIIGLYGSLAHMVQLRQREIGIRVALGALRSQVIRLILMRGAIVAGSGLLAGALCASLAGRAIQGQLFGVELTDSQVWLGVLGGVVIAATLSAALPAWRAARIEPAIALRHE